VRTTSLSVFSDPRSVAVIGASADPAKWGHWVARGALRGADRRDVHLVNARGAVIEGTRSVPSLAALGEAPELVVLCAPADTVPDIVDEALDRGVRGFLGITAGIDAVHGPGAELRLAARIRAAGARLIGPNCLGVYDAAHELELAWGTFTPGNLAVVSQSGQLGLEIAGLAAHAGLGISRFVSLGNQVDVTAVDVLDDLLRHDATKAVIVYLESFADGRDLVAAMTRLRESGRPVVVLTVGASEASRLAARSHTGALTSATAVVTAACEAAGAVLVDTPVEAVDLAHLLLGSPFPQGRRVAVVSDSGGQGALASDTLSRHGLVVPRLRAETSARLSDILPAAAGVGNPVDLAGGGEKDLDTYARVVDILLRSDEVDAVVLSGYFGCYGAETPTLADRELEVIETLGGTVRRHGRPVLVHSMSHDSVAVRAMREKAVPTLHTIDAVARSLGLAADLAVPPRGLGAGPDGPSADLALAAPADYLTGRDRLEAYGVRYPRARAIRTREDVDAAVGALTAPFVLKAGWIEHRTDVGGVVVGLEGTAEVRHAFEDMHGRLGDGGFVLEEMDRRPDVVELIVGARRDPSFGPIVMVGMGGVLAEVYRDVRLGLAPVSDSQARAMLSSLQAFAVLEGWRGRPALDVGAAARVVSAVSRVLAEQSDIAECEINPLRVGVDGAVAVDALVIQLPDCPVGEPADDASTLTEFLP
jgi:acyl-CoA synthetase (NDP forming)